ncbi:MAG: DUF554 family protein [Clostridia bacterium]|nr:DUF554 family protein [Clostridia bacterium]
MGIAINGLSIISGCLLGNRLRSRITFNNFLPLGIAIMIMSLMGFLENILNVSNGQINSNSTLIVVFSLIIGTYIGEFLRIDDKLSNFAKCKHNEYNAFIDAALFFGVGGLQLSGSIVLAVNNDSSQLILKSLVDFPFALMFGISYGKITSLSAFPVMTIQIIIALIAYFARDFLTADTLAQLCAMGYIILFFSGFNLVCERKYRINNTDMLPSVIIIIIVGLFLYIWRLIV